MQTCAAAVFSTTNGSKKERRGRRTRGKKETGHTRSHTQNYPTFLSSSFSSALPLHRRQSLKILRFLPTQCPVKFVTHMALAAASNSDRDSSSCLAQSFPSHWRWRKLIPCFFGFFSEGRKEDSRWTEGTKHGREEGVNEENDDDFRFGGRRKGGKAKQADNGSKLYPEIPWNYPAAASFLP